jgi:hypothetical protein
MNKIKLFIIFIIVLIGAGIGVGIYLGYKNKKIRFIGNRQLEHFTTANDNNLLPDEQANAIAEGEERLIGSSPESSYKFRNYFLEREPVESQVVRHEVSHELPEGVLYSDITMSTDNKIRFSDDTDDINNDKFRIHPSTDKNHLKLYIKDRPGTNDNSFQIWGKACTIQGDCNGEGGKLHVFSDEPSYKLKSADGADQHRLGAGGDAAHRGALKMGNPTSPKHIVDGRTGNQYTDGVVNTRDANIRGKLWFSNTPHNQNPETSDLWGSHDSDKMSIEKVRHSQNKNSLRMTINDDANDRLEVVGGKSHFGVSRTYPLMQVTGKGNVWAKDTMNAKDVNVRGRIYFSNAGVTGGDDVNDIINPQDPNFDRNKWNTMHDSDPYYIEKHNYGPNRNALRITLNDDYSGAGKENLEIFGGSCEQGGDKCIGGEGTKIMNIGSDKKVEIFGELWVNGVKIAG